MEKILTDDQKRLHTIWEDLKKHSWRIMLEKELKERLNMLEKILLWEMSVQDEFTGNKANIDEIKYSLWSKLRWERQVIKDLLNLPDAKIKSFGIYQKENKSAK